MGLYIRKDLNYIVVEKTSNDSFQALWIEIINDHIRNIVCGVIYRQHNSPEPFLQYIEETLEKYSSTGKKLSVWWGTSILTCLKLNIVIIVRTFYRFCKVFHFCQRLIGRPESGNSATLIDNRLITCLDMQITSGNIVSDISDHFSQVCSAHSIQIKESRSFEKTKVRDYSHFNAQKFKSQLAQLDWSFIKSQN